MKYGELAQMLSLINDNTDIYIRNKDMQPIARGKWFNDQILDYSDHEISAFAWRSSNKVFVDLK